MAYTTASRPTAQIQALFCHAAEQTSTESIADVVSKECPFLEWLDAEGMLKEEPIGYAIRDHTLTVNDVPVTSLTPGQADPVFFSTGLSARQYAPVVLRAPVALGWEETLGIREENEIESLGETRVYQAARKISEQIEVDGVGGQAIDATKLFGIEQFVQALTHDTTVTTTALALSAPSWKFRKSNNTVGGVTRTPFTGPDAGGTGFENLCMDFTALGVAGGSRTFDATAGATNALTQCFEWLYLLATRGMTSATHIMMTGRPYRDAKRIGQTLFQFRREGAASGGVNWGVSELRYLNADVYLMKTLSATGLNGGPVTAGGEMIYGLHAPTVKYIVDDRYNFDWQYPTWQTIGNPSAIYNELVFRAQHIHYRPDLEFCIAGYGT
jgi:hypothetical protein